LAANRCSQNTLAMKSRFTHCSRLQLDIAQSVSLKISRRLVVMEKVRDRMSRAELEQLEIGRRCRLRKSTEDVRKLMDVTDVPENADYQHYRAKLETKQEASRRFREAQASGADGAEAVPTDNVCRPPTKSERLKAVLRKGRTSRSGSSTWP